MSDKAQLEPNEPGSTSNTTSPHNLHDHRRGHTSQLGTSHLYGAGTSRLHEIPGAAWHGGSGFGADSRGSSVFDLPVHVHGHGVGHGPSASTKAWSTGSNSTIQSHGRLRGDSSSYGHDKFAAGESLLEAGWRSNQTNDEMQGTSGKPHITKPSFVVISGGTGCNSICSAFGNADACYALPVSDDGGSSSEIIRVFGGPSIGEFACISEMHLFKFTNVSLLSAMLSKATYVPASSVSSRIPRQARHWIGFATCSRIA